MTKVGVLGSTGRMGRAILEALENHPRCTLSALGTRDNAAHLFEVSDVVIDFTAPDALITHVNLSLQYKKPLVVGTTGLLPHHHQLMSSAAAQIPLVVASNMSPGIVLLTKFVEQAAHCLDENYDIEITELHHRHKKDAPSGTSLLLGQSAAKGRNKPLDDLKCDHNRPCERKRGAIGFSVQRGGSITGDHSIRFIGDEEMVEFSHRGLSRTVYAKGALRAAEWVVKQKPGLYSMANVLGF